jgi:hypothetical protein
VGTPGTPFEVPASHNLGLVTEVQIAADSAGNVYVPVVPENEVREYSPSGTLLKTFTGSGAGALKEPTAVAVDSSGDLWVADGGNHRIEKLSPAGAPLEEIESEGAQTLALDGRGDVLAILKNDEDFCGAKEPPCSHLVEYSSTGARLADVGAGSFEAGRGIPVIPMVAVNEANGRIYVTDGSRGVVWIFGPPTSPVVERELTSEATISEAKLGALINPGGLQTTYRFEYGATTAYGHSVPFPEGSVGEGVSSRTVWASASGLAPGTTYHYRVVATNELGTAVGPDQTFATLTAVQAACLPNEEFRGGFSARLPDCRAYEVVTPPTKNSVEVKAVRAIAADGDAVAFQSNVPMPAAPSGSDYYLATRGPGGWSSEDVIPLESYSEPTCAEESQNGPKSYSADLSTAIIEYGQSTRASSGGKELTNQSCNAEGLQVVPGEPVGYSNLLLRDNASGTYRLINTLPSGVTPADAHFKGASADLSHVVFTETSPLTEGATYGVENLYEWDEGALRVLSVLPSGTPAVGASLPEAHTGNNAEAHTDKNAISSEGSHILFSSGGGLYDRIGGELTVRIDESQGGSGPSGGGSFQAATSDGSKIFFTDESRLTADSTAESGEPDLYECDLPEGAAECQLTDLTIAKAGEHADVIVVSPLGGKDSSRVYFTARGVLATNRREYTEAEGNTVIEEAESGQNNLYVWHEGTTTFIATLKSGASEDFGLGRASPDGTWFAFDSHKSLTGYDNTEPGGEPTEEVFLYDAISNQLACASCNPSGEAPIAGGTKVEPGSPLRFLSDGGHLFFETGEALVPSDTNGQKDVYEYEDGHVYLISSGTSQSDSTFVGTSESSGDVFFRSNQALVPQDAEEGMNAIYDARVYGGFPAPASSSPCTTADACRTPVPPQPSIYGAPSSQTFFGVGNLTPSEAKPKKIGCKKGFVKKKSKCVKTKRKKKQPKKKSRARAKKSRPRGMR